MTDKFSNTEVELSTLKILSYAARDYGEDALPRLLEDVRSVTRPIMSEPTYQRIFATAVHLIETGTPPTPLEIQKALPDMPKAIWKAIDGADEGASLYGNIKTLQGMAAAREARAALVHGLEQLEQGMQPESVFTAVLAADAKSGTSLTTPKKAKQFNRPSRYLKALSEGRIKMLQLGFRQLDDRLGGGMELGSYVLVGMQTNIGKTRLALRITLNMLLRGEGVVYLTGEMKDTAGDDDERTNRLLLALTLMHANIPPGNVGEGVRISDATQAKIEQAEDWLMDESGLEIHDGDMSVDTIAVIARRMKREGATLMVIDNFNHVTLPSAGKQQAAWDVKNTISERLAEIAHSTGVTIMTLLQTTVTESEEPPTLLQISDSKGISRPADLILTAHRDLEAAAEKADAGHQLTYGKVAIRKRRQGKGGIVKVGWREDLASWVDVDPRLLAGALQ
ncbi:DnaB-like helicase C-terminal domain-containing protein [Deinococcus fonticola]|uniref:DnaB-like helicase C-terminal domain-containing protein n=1 Tax=Deinococcus fonticola TaxID=2528713 RepID=UPI0010753DAC|nr:DnaB-like helicase C-terminal domain-containing protein [Deinococcus fonticola]